MAQIRHNFGEIDLKVPSPALLDIQVGSYQEFIQLETTAENRVNEGLSVFFKRTFLSQMREISSS